MERSRKKSNIKKDKKIIIKGNNYDCFFSLFSQVDYMDFLYNEYQFFKDEFFSEQLLYYLDIAPKESEESDNEDHLDDNKSTKKIEKNQDDKTNV